MQRVVVVDDELNEQEGEKGREEKSTARGERDYPRGAEKETYKKSSRIQYIWIFCIQMYCISGDESLWLVFLDVNAGEDYRVYNTYIVRGHEAVAFI